MHPTLRGRSVLLCLLTGLLVLLPGLAPWCCAATATPWPR